MAVVVKNNPETATPTILDRLPVASVLGAAYVLVTLIVAFGLVPYVFWEVLGLSRQSFFAIATEGVVAIALMAGMIYVGATRLAPKHLPGLRAGIFVVLVGLALILTVTRWLGLLLDSWLFTSFGDSNLPGVIITLAVGAIMLFFAVRAFFRPTFERKLIAFEEQGWFSATAYKRTQGIRVRRGTMAGILAIVACGIYTMQVHNTLKIGDRDWKLGIPFTPATVVVKSPGDTKLRTDEPIDRNEFRAANDALAGKIKLESAGDSAKLAEFQVKELVDASLYNEERSRLEAAEGKNVPMGNVPTRATAGPTRFRGVTILPDVELTVPLIIAALALWFAWRFANFPVFADFLIATEAELNKVSWTTRKRLVQDTIVVLVTVVLMTVLLLVVDVVWGKLLASPWIGVLKTAPTQTNQQGTENETPW
jgi:preprotein translocase SecE subunit